MSTNPNNAVGTNAAYNGRTSVKAFNDGIGAYSSGILTGWACSPNTGMTVSLGGDGTTRDIAIAEDVAGNKTTINNISEAPISVTMGAAPSTNSRIDLIVAYVDNPPQGAATSIDNPGACGLITVMGTAAASPVAPSESAIRTAITADGASGSTAYYVILAQITIAAGTTDIVAGNISAGSAAGIGAKNIDFATMRETFPIFNGATSNSNVNSNQWYRQYQYNVPQKGRYLVVFSQKMTDGDSNYDFSVGISLNDTVLNSVSSGGGAYVNYITPSVTAVVDAEVDDTINCLSRGGGTGSKNTAGGQVSIAKIA